MPHTYASESLCGLWSRETVVKDSVVAVPTTRLLDPNPNLWVELPFNGMERP